MERRDRWVAGIRKKKRIEQGEQKANKKREERDQNARYTLAKKTLKFTKTK